MQRRLWITSSFIIQIAVSTAFDPEIYSRLFFECRRDAESNSLCSMIKLRNELKQGINSKFDYILKELHVLYIKEIESSRHFHGTLRDIFACRTGTNQLTAIRNEVDEALSKVSSSLDSKCAKIYMTDGCCYLFHLIRCGINELLRLYSITLVNQTYSHDKIGNWSSAYDKVYEIYCRVIESVAESLTNEFNLPTQKLIDDMTILKEALNDTSIRLKGVAAKELIFAEITEGNIKIALNYYFTYLNKDGKTLNDIIEETYNRKKPDNIENLRNFVTLLPSFSEINQGVTKLMQEIKKNGHCKIDYCHEINNVTMLGYCAKSDCCRLESRTFVRPEYHTDRESCIAKNSNSNRMGRQSIGDFSSVVCSYYPACCEKLWIFNCDNTFDAITEANHGNECYYEGFEKCRLNEQCCSGFCDKDTYAEFGVCKQKLAATEATTTVPVIEYDDGDYDDNDDEEYDEECSDCNCSEFCEDDDDVCKEEPLVFSTTTTAVPTEECEDDESDEDCISEKCQEDEQCCAGVCVKITEGCKEKPTERSKPQPSSSSSSSSSTSSSPSSPSSSPPEQSSFSLTSPLNTQSHPPISLPLILPLPIPPLIPPSSSSSSTSSSSSSSSSSPSSPSSSPPEQSSFSSTSSLITQSPPPISLPPILPFPIPPLIPPLVPPFIPLSSSSSTSSPSPPSSTKIPSEPSSFLTIPSLTTTSSSSLSLPATSSLSTTIPPEPFSFSTIPTEPSSFSTISLITTTSSPLSLPATSSLSTTIPSEPSSVPTIPPLTTTSPFPLSLPATSSLSTTMPPEPFSFSTIPSEPSSFSTIPPLITTPLSLPPFSPPPIRPKPPKPCTVRSKPPIRWRVRPKPPVPWLVRPKLPIPRPIRPKPPIPRPARPRPPITWEIMHKLPGTLESIIEPNLPATISTSGRTPSWFFSRKKRTVEKCENDGFEKCIENEQCCSGFCCKNIDEEYGVCQSDFILKRISRGVESYAPKKKKRKCKKPDEKKPGEKKSKCPKPEILMNNTKIIRKTVEQCENTEPSGKCRFFCQPGYNEVPRELTCLENGEWDETIRCEPQTCQSNGQVLILVDAPNTVSPMASESTDIDATENNIVLYAALFDIENTESLWTVAYHTQIMQKKHATVNRPQYYQHPCLTINKKEYKDDFKRLVEKGYQRGHFSPASLYRWNIKAAYSANLYINIAPQAKNFNIGVWKKLERGVNCISKSLKMIVATGTGGNIVERSGIITVREYFWKMICYIRDGETHVAAFIGHNKNKDSLTAIDNKQYTLTARDQNEVIKLIFSNLKDHNPWDAAAEILNRNAVEGYPAPEN